MNPIDEQYKNKIGARLAQRIGKAVEAGEIKEGEFSQLSSYILEGMENAKDSATVLDFLVQLSNKWPIFADILTLEEGEMKGQKEEAAVEKAEALIKENKIDEALKVAENATE